MEPWLLTLPQTFQVLSGLLYMLFPLTEKVLVGFPDPIPVCERGVSTHTTPRNFWTPVGYPENSSQF